MIRDKKRLKKVEDFEIQRRKRARCGDAKCFKGIFGFFVVLCILGYLYWNGYLGRSGPPPEEVWRNHMNNVMYDLQQTHPNDTFIAVHCHPRADAKFRKLFMDDGRKNKKMKPRDSNFGLLKAIFHQNRQIYQNDAVVLYAQMNLGYTIVPHYYRPRKQTRAPDPNDEAAAAEGTQAALRGRFGEAADPNYFYFTRIIAKSDQLRFFRKLTNPDGSHILLFTTRNQHKSTFNLDLAKHLWYKDKAATHMAEVFVSIEFKYCGQGENLHTSRVLKANRVHSSVTRPVFRDHCAVVLLPVLDESISKSKYATKKQKKQAMAKLAKLPKTAIAGIFHDSQLNGTLREYSEIRINNNLYCPVRRFDYLRYFGLEIEMM